MSIDLTRLKYTGSTPGADANGYVLFATAPVAAGAAGATAANAGSVPVGDWAPDMDIHVFRYLIKNPAAGTVNGWYSLDRGATWVQFYTMAAPIPVAGLASADVVSVEGLRDFAFVWVNGGVAQTGWTVNMSVSIFP